VSWLRPLHSRQLKWISAATHGSNGSVMCVRMRYGIIIRMLALHSTELLIAMKPVLLLWIRVRLQVGSKYQIYNHVTGTPPEEALKSKYNWYNTEYQDLLPGTRYRTYVHQSCNLALDTTVPSYQVAMSLELDCHQSYTN